MLRMPFRSSAVSPPVRRPKWAAATLILSLALMLAACGESGEGEAPIPDTTPVAPVAPEAVPAAPPAAPAAMPAAPVERAPGPEAAIPATPPPPPAPAPEAGPIMPAEPVPAVPPEPAPAGPVVAPETPAAPPLPAIPVVALPGETDPALVARLAVADPDAGRLVAARCSACHAFEAGAGAGNGPNLYDVLGGPVGGASGFAYSPALAALGATGAVWSYDLLDAFIAAPSVTVPGTRMGFGGLSDEVERASLIAYLRSLSDAPLALPGDPAADPFRAGIKSLGLRPVVFTVEQVQIGRDYYRRYCATCHGLSFEGIWYGTEWGQATPLADERFERRWFVRSLADFVAAMEETDILNYASLHDGLSPDRYVAVAAYLLEQYGFVAGDVPLPVEPEALRGIGFWQ